MKFTSLAIALVALSIASVGRSGDCGCEPTCGCCGCCMKPVCRIVCEMKEVKETCYSCKCEDFCVPGKSECVGHHPECDCCGCVKMKPTYKPCWCDIFCRKKLYKKEIVKKVPHYKCVVEYVCCRGCGCGCGHHGHCHAQADGSNTIDQSEVELAADAIEPAATEAIDYAADFDFAPPRPQPPVERQAVVSRAPSRLLPPPPLPEVQPRDADVQQASHTGKPLRLRLK